MTTMHLVSLSKLTQLCQQPYRKVVAAIDALGIKPVQTIDDARYYDAEVHEQIAKHLEQRRKQ